MSTEKFTMQQFEDMFPDEETCLDLIFQNRYGSLKECPSCHKPAGFHRVSERKCYACQWCSYQIHPLANTIFHKSETTLKKWFRAIYEFSQTKNGISAKELQRKLGVTYKTAWRMGQQIRLLFIQTQDKLGGIVEMDETLIGGKSMGVSHKQALQDKTIIFGMIQRKGRVIAEVVPNSKKKTLMPIIKRNVREISQIHTDEAHQYRQLGRNGYIHYSVNHHAKEYVRGQVSTNAIEGFWSQLKRSIRGTYHHVGPDYLQAYVNEFSYRFSRRHDVRPIFFPMIESVGRPVL